MKIAVASLLCLLLDIRATSADRMRFSPFCFGGMRTFWLLPSRFASLSGYMAYLIRRFLEIESKSKKAPSSSPNHMASISIDHFISLKSVSNISLSTSSGNSNPSWIESWYGNPHTKSVLESSSMSLNVSSILLKDQWSLK